MCWNKWQPQLAQQASGRFEFVFCSRTLEVKGTAILLNRFEEDMLEIKQSTILTKER
jgi:hypothetical protein